LPSLKNRKYFKELANLSIAARRFFDKCDHGKHLLEQDLIDLLQEGHMARRHLRCVSDRAFAARPCVLAASKNQHHPAHLRRTLRDESIAQIASKIKAVYAGQPI
jgi:glyoxylate/hydroxypyruvate reductase A